MRTDVVEIVFLTAFATVAQAKPPSHRVDAAGGADFFPTSRSPVLSPWPSGRARSPTGPTRSPSRAPPPAADAGAHRRSSRLRCSSGRKVSSRPSRGPQRGRGSRPGSRNVHRWSDQGRALDGRRRHVERTVPARRRGLSGCQCELLQWPWNVGRAVALRRPRAAMGVVDRCGPHVVGATGRVLDTPHDRFSTSRPCRRRTRDVDCPLVRRWRRRAGPRRPLQELGGRRCHVAGAAPGVRRRESRRRTVRSLAGARWPCAVRPPRPRGVRTSCQRHDRERRCGHAPAIDGQVTGSGQRLCRCDRRERGVHPPADVARDQGAGEPAELEHAACSGSRGRRQGRRIGAGEEFAVAGFGHHGVAGEEGAQCRRPCGTREREVRVLSDAPHRRSRERRR